MSHTYKHNGYEFPSVTTVLGAVDGQKARPLMQWSSNMCVDYIRENCHVDFMRSNLGIPEYIVSDEDLDKARFAYKTVSQTALDVGSEVHYAIEEYLKLTLQENEFIEPAYIACGLQGQAANAFCAFLRWMDEHEVKPIALEQTVYGPCWAGMLDFVGWFDGKIYVIDWKTSKQLQKQYRYQIAAYRWAYSQQYLDIEPVKGCGVLRIDKETGEPEWKDHSKTYERDLAAFNAAVEFYMHDHPRIAKKAGWK